MLLNNLYTQLETKRSALARSSNTRTHTDPIPFICIVLVYIYDEIIWVMQQELVKAREGARRYLAGGLRVVHQYHDMTNYSALYWDMASGRDIKVQNNSRIT